MVLLLGAIMKIFQSKSCLLKHCCTRDTRTDNAFSDAMRSASTKQTRQESISDLHCIGVSHSHWRCIQGNFWPGFLLPERTHAWVTIKEETFLDLSLKLHFLVRWSSLESKCNVSETGETLIILYLWYTVQAWPRVRRPWGSSRLKKWDY